MRDIFRIYRGNFGGYFTSRKFPRHLIQKVESDSPQSLIDEEMREVECLITTAEKMEKVPPDIIIMAYHNEYTESEIVDETITSLGGTRYFQRSGTRGKR